MITGDRRPVALRIWSRTSEHCASGLALGEKGDTARDV